VFATTQRAAAVLSILTCHHHHHHHHQWSPCCHRHHQWSPCFHQLAADGVASAWAASATTTLSHDCGTLPYLTASRAGEGPSNGPSNGPARCTVDWGEWSPCFHSQAGWAGVQSAGGAITSLISILVCKEKQCLGAVRGAFCIDQ
jgi:hypothetical protein